MGAAALEEKMHRTVFALYAIDMEFLDEGVSPAEWQFRTANDIALFAAEDGESDVSVQDRAIAWARTNAMANPGQRFYLARLTPIGFAEEAPQLAKFTPALSVPAQAA